MKYAISIILLVCLSFSLGFAQTYTTSDSIPFSISTMANGWLADWDSVYAFLFYKTSLLDSTKLTKDRTGSYLGKHNPLSNTGGYVVKYFAYYEGNISADDWFFTVENFGGDSVTAVAYVWDLIEAVGCTGTGSDTLQVWARAGGTMQPNVKITVKNTSGTPLAFAYTSGNGHITFNLDPATYRIYPSGGNIIWDSTYFTSVVPSGGLIDTVTGSIFIPTLPTDPLLCAIWVDAKDIGLNKIDHFEIKVKPALKQNGSNLRTDEGTMIYQKAYSAFADTGYAVVNVPRSALLRYNWQGGIIDTVAYDIWVSKKEDGDIFYKANVIIPDSASYHLTNVF